LGVVPSCASAASTALVLTCALLSGYLGALTLAGGRTWRADIQPKNVRRRRFVIVVPAHDEEPVIARALESFSQLDYPTERHEVHVVADNCTDGTAAVDFNGANSPKRAYFKHSIGAKPALYFDMSYDAGGQE
jgi:cellulose synthase/poly-beta-1,6-N-acetylglucosamine synthase-like glycosyltransferase